MQPTTFADEKPQSASEQALAEQCPKPDPEKNAPNWPRSKTYEGEPFAPGEEARFSLKYGALKVLVGYGFLRVGKPVKQSITVGVDKDGKPEIAGRWHRVFTAEAYTGDWYKMIFAAHDKIQSFSRPWDEGASKFYISQDEEKPFVRRYHREKWLDFDQVNCQVDERENVYHKKKEKQGQFFLQPGATDAMSAFFRLRSLKFELGKVERFLVYTSEKNWWLEARPIVEESLKTPIGEFKAMKTEVHSYLGQELQQKGKLYVWIAHEHPNRPILKIEGEVTFGKIYLELDQFKPGRP